MSKDERRSQRRLGIVAQKQENQPSERRRLPRLSLSSAQFKLTSNGKIYGIKNLSEKGMAIWLLETQELQSFSVGQLIHGTINLKGEKLSLFARVKHLALDQIGCAFENLSKEETQTLHAYLKRG